VSAKLYRPNHNFPLIRGAELSIQNAQRGSLPSRQNTKSWFGDICLLALLMTVALAFGATPAAARYKVRHRPEHKIIEHASKAPFGDIPNGPLQIFISIDQQKLHLYSDGVHVADTSVATGVPGLPTPLGVFSVIQKQIFHRSNIYSGAPMPFMERITWSGVAMHEGEGIGHRASHGCIRMPHDFAVGLYRLTKLGVPVIIARSELKPVEFADPHLFVHRANPPQQIEVPPAAFATQLPAAATVGGASPASSGTPNPAALGLRASTDSGAAAPVAVADGAKPNAIVNDAAKSAAPPAAVTASLVSDQQTEPPPPNAITPAPAAGPDDRPPIPPAGPAGLVKGASASKAPIAIFISRKERKIYVRQDFAPLFQAPVTIADPDRALGTHVFTAMEFVGADHATLRWNVVSLPGEPPLPPTRRAERETRYEKYVRGRHRGEASENLAALPPPQPPAEALARIDIPPAAIDYISELIAPGSSLIVSDQGLSEETGDGTNFIVLAR